MKKWVLILILLAIIIIVGIFSLSWKGITGRTVEDVQFGPSQSEIQCMSSCMKCSSPGVNCTGNQQECQTQCNAKKPEQTSEESCVETCTKKGCGEYDFLCQSKNREACDEECGMTGDKPDESDMSAEQLCITNCVAKIDPNIRCGASQTGETGGEACQRCASSCVHLYAGPCLDDTKLKAKQKECETCEHCYGEPMNGDSGEGWDCIVNVECKDATSEFGDEDGTGPGIGQEGFVAKVGDTIGNVVESIGNFFRNLFG